MNPESHVWWKNTDSWAYHQTEYKERHYGNCKGTRVTREYLTANGETRRECSEENDAYLDRHRTAYPLQHRLLKPYDEQEMDQVDIVGCRGELPINPDEI